MVQFPRVLVLAALSLLSPIACGPQADWADQEGGADESGAVADGSDENYGDDEFNEEDPEWESSQSSLSTPVGSQATADIAFAGIAPRTILHVAVTGNDSNPGTQAKPWRTIGKAARSLTAGQAAYVHAGRYDEHVETTNNGTASAPIALMGAPGEAKPLVVAKQNTAVFRITKAYWKVQGFEINGNNLQGQALRVEGGHHVVIADNYAHDGSGGSGISVYNGAHNVGIQRNIIKRYRWFVNGARRDSHGIHVLPNATRIFVQGNESAENSGDGLQCTGVAEAGFGTANPTDVVIEDNRFHHNLENAIDIKSCQRITIRGGPLDSSKFYSHRAAEDTGSNCAGTAVVLHFGAAQILFEKNRLWDNGIGITVGRDDALAQNIVIRNNLFFNNTTAGRGCGDGIRVARVKNMEISNNSIDGMPRSGIRIGADTYNTKSENVAVWNNIVRNSLNVLDIATVASPGFSSDRNMFFKVGGVPGIRHNGTVRTLDGWKSASGYDKSSVVADPKWPADPLASDYMLTDGSPAIDKGMMTTAASGRMCGSNTDLGFLERCP